ncbi:TIGR03503 family protein [Colwellia echini]|uniref:TIGR03503 family protein n=2 Tax=Colwellia echini TaxID=1982103 RepID=A0ABY3MUS5_9GAMM|nr:TIGR03503 family protein [Colwellia echini]
MLVGTLLTLLLSFNANAFYSTAIESAVQTASNESAVINDEIVEAKKLDVSAVNYYQKDNITNQIPYFDNRFRLDANIEEITLIFYRKSGSTPIILIRPDGSKIRVNNFDEEKVQWFDDSTFDMIKIIKPMPGPWQAVGDILPQSQILVVSDVKLVVEPLPEIAFSGETLKVEGKLINGNEPIRTPHFKDVVKLDVNFYSTNNSLFDNFGADAIKVTSFRDDGYALDEYANDNIFTGEFVLDFAPGEWQPVYFVKLPMTTRELNQRPIVLQKNPIEISVVQSDDVEKPHQLILTIDSSFVDPNSLVFQGKFTYPDRQSEPFSIMEDSGVTRTTTITNTEPGIYRVNVNAFGQSTTGREFRLVVPEFSFNVEKALELTTPMNMKDGQPLNIQSADDFIVDLDEDIEEAIIAQQQAKSDQDQKIILLIVAANIVIIIVGLVLFWIMRRK